MDNRSSPSLEQSMSFLKEQNARLETFQTQMSSDMQASVQKAKELATKLIAVEQRAGELQKKYDESKRGYFKLREDREKLKSELEKIKGVEVEGDQQQN